MLLKCHCETNSCISQEAVTVKKKAEQNRSTFPGLKHEGNALGELTSLANTPLSCEFQLQLGQLQIDKSICQKNVIIM